MRIFATNAAATAATAPSARRAASGSFSVADPESPTSAGSAAALRTVGGIDALLALQGIGDATERRRRAVKGGRLALDALDELKIGLISGDLDPAMLQRLKSAAAGLQDASGEPGLDAVLAEIDLRIAVEIAKFGHASA